MEEGTPNTESVSNVGDVSNKTIVVLVVLTVIISVISTLVVLAEVNDINLEKMSARAPQLKANAAPVGKVELEILPKPAHTSASGMVTFEVLKKS